MSYSTPFRIVVCAAVVGWRCGPACALTIQLDYEHDTYFGGNPTAKAALEAAAADLSNAITTTLAPITTDSYQGQFLSTTVTFNADFYYTNPSTGSQVSRSQLTLAPDEFRVYVGGRSLAAATLGVGGAGAVGLGWNANGYGSQLNGAVSTAAQHTQTALKRGGGPVVGMHSGSIALDGATAIYSLDYGSTLGNFWIDLDTNNDTYEDSPSQLESYWHFDHTTPVAVGKSDLYSVALHELMHTLGIGTAASWDALASGTTWYGAEAIAWHGTGEGLLTADANHIAANIKSPRISDGVLQEVVMDPSLTVGRRKKLTFLDLAFLSDIGWDTITPVVPAGPEDFNHNGLIDAGDLAMWRTAFGATAEGDANYDGATTGADLLLWQRAYASPAIANVPEPAAIGLAVLGAWLLFSRPTRRT